MTVAVQYGLDGIKQQLILNGFDVVTYGENNCPIDALVYASSISIEQIQHYANLTSAKTSARGIFLVNAQNKTADEIIQILIRRSYSPVF